MSGEREGSIDGVDVAIGVGVGESAAAGADAEENEGAGSGSGAVASGGGIKLGKGAAASVGTTAAKGGGMNTYSRVGVRLPVPAWYVRAGGISGSHVWC